MKTAKKNPNLTIYRSRRPAYPNAAGADYFARKALDIATAILSAAGFVTAIVFLLMLT